MDLCDGLFDHIVNTALTDAYSNNESSLAEILNFVCCHLLHHIVENDNSILALLSGENSDLFLGYFKDSLSNIVNTYFLAHYSSEPIALPKEYLFNHISGSFVEMVQFWIKRKCKKTPEELTRFFTSVIEPIMG